MGDHLSSPHVSLIQSDEIQEHSSYQAMPRDRPSCNPSLRTNEANKIKQRDLLTSLRVCLQKKKYIYMRELSSSLPLK